MFFSVAAAVRTLCLRFARFVACAFELQTCWPQRARTFLVECEAAVQHQLAVAETQEQLLLKLAPINSPSVPAAAVTATAGPAKGLPGGSVWRLWPRLCKLLLTQKRKLLQVKSQFQQAAALLALLCCCLQRLLSCAQTYCEQQHYPQPRTTTQQKVSEDSGKAPLSFLPIGEECSCSWLAECLLRACDLSWSSLESHLWESCSSLVLGFSVSVESVLREAPVFLAPQKKPPAYNLGCPESAGEAVETVEVEISQSSKGFVMLESAARGITAEAVSLLQRSAANVQDSAAAGGTQRKGLKEAKRTEQGSVSGSPLLPSAAAPQIAAKTPNCAHASSLENAAATAAKPQRRERSASCEVVWRLPSPPEGLEAITTSKSSERASSVVSGKFLKHPSLSGMESSDKLETLCARTSAVELQVKSGVVSSLFSMRSGEEAIDPRATPAAAAMPPVSWGRKDFSMRGPPTGLWFKEKSGAFQTRQNILQPQCALPVDSVSKLVERTPADLRSSGSEERSCLQRLHQLAADAVQAMQEALDQAGVQLKGSPLQRTEGPQSCLTDAETADVGSLLASALLSEESASQLKRMWAAVAPKTAAGCPVCVCDHDAPSAAGLQGADRVCGCTSGGSTASFSRTAWSSGAFAPFEEPSSLFGPLMRPACSKGCLRLPCLLLSVLHETHAKLRKEFFDFPGRLAASAGFFENAQARGNSEFSGAGGNPKKETKIPFENDLRNCCLFLPPFCSDVALRAVSEKARDSSRRGNLSRRHPGGSNKLRCSSSSNGGSPAPSPLTNLLEGRGLDLECPGQWCLASSLEGQKRMRAALEAAVDGKELHIQVNELGDDHTHSVTIFFAPQVRHWLAHEDVPCYLASMSRQGMCPVAEKHILGISLWIIDVFT